MRHDGKNEGGFLLRLGLAVLAAVMSLSVPTVPAEAAAVFYSQDTPLTLTGSGANLTILAGSRSASFALTPTTFTVTVAAAETFTIRASGPDPVRFRNTGGLEECTLTGGDNVLIVNGPVNVTFSPSGYCEPGATAVPFGAVIINNGQLTAVSRNVTVSLSVSNALEVILSENIDFAGAAYRPAVSSIDFTLSAGSGVKRIYAIFKNGTLTSSVVSDDIAYDPSASPDQAQNGDAIVFETISGRYDPISAAKGIATINVDKDLQTAVGTPGCGSNTLIKVPDDRNPGTVADTAVYYCGADGKRYVFPDEGTYYSWYADFKPVRIVNAADLAQIPIGGNVTYKPGVKMLKIQSDPKIYAIAKNGTLRWVQSEAAAATLYGDAWNRQVNDISDAFFINYKIGAPIGTGDITPGYQPPSGTPAPSPPPAPAGGCTTSTEFVNFLEKGMEGSEVLALQQLLVCLGYFPENVEANGYFGPTTEASVKAFQAANGIDAFGYVGPGTRAVLNKYKK